MVWVLVVVLSWFWHALVYAQGLPFPGPGVKGYGAAGGPVTFDAVASGQCDGATCTAGRTVLTYTHTTGSGIHRALAVGVCVSGASATVQPATSTVTYAGISLTSKKKQGTNYYCELWSLPDGTEPATGANSVVVTLASAIDTTGNSLITSASLSFAGVDQTTAWTSSSNGNAGNSASATLTFTAAGANDLGPVFVCNGTSVLSTNEDNLTKRFTATANTAGACNTLGAATSALSTTSMTYTVGNDSWLIIGGSLKAG